MVAHEEQLLRRALALAEAAVGLASPNPTVGCVLTNADGHVLGEGSHLYDARDHAEIAALKQAATAGRSVVGATAHVTLEPCAHQGRTGPCADALVAAGIARCVVATADPNPQVAGQGIARMRAAGIDVVMAQGPLRERARRLNDAFACVMGQRRPFVVLKAALSVDGMLAPPVTSRDAGAPQTLLAPYWITGAAARQDVQALRHAADAIVTGIGTVLADDPSLTDRSGRARRRPLLRVVLDSWLRLPLTSKLVQSAGGDVLVVCREDASTTAEAKLAACGVQVLRVAAGEGRIDLNAMLRWLAERQVLSVLVEAGSAVNAAFLRADLVDKVVLYFAEIELGADAVPFAAGFGSPYALQQRLSGLARCGFAADGPPGGEDVRVSGYLHDPWAGVA